MSTAVEELILQTLSLGSSNSKGWRSIKCASCDDYKVRAAFNFSDGVVTYKCFNCSLVTKFDNSKHRVPSEKFRNLLRSFNIDEQSLSQAIGKTFLNNTPIVSETFPKGWIPPKTLEHKFQLLSDANCEWSDILKDYIVSRGLSIIDYPFMISYEKNHEGRLIIPYYYQNRMVYYQARSVDDSIIKPRYLNPASASKDIIFNHSELYRGSVPLYVTEGAIDALSIGSAIAIESTLNEWKILELKKCKRELVFVIDKNPVGYKLGKEVLKNGWSVVIMPGNIKDANHALISYGKIWLLNHLLTTKVSGIAGELLLRMKCK